MLCDTLEVVEQRLCMLLRGRQRLTRELGDAGPAARCDVFFHRPVLRPAEIPSESSSHRRASIGQHGQHDTGLDSRTRAFVK